MKHIGFIGASGLMGHGIAKNLLAKGFQVSLTSHSKQEPLKDLLAAGAKLVGCHADLSACDAVIIYVTGTPQVEAALEGPQGILSRARVGLLTPTEIRAISKTMTTCLTGYAEILFWFKPNPAAKYFRFAAHATQ
ncbi:MAG: NAD(P)-dependent oxidoreductase [Limnohabitans sp.]|nr:NAD(P)-dependent oxidoreductase [Limnohabitans sp.]